MFYTVTLNPAIDRTVYIDSFSCGVLNRERASVTMAGGKGINCSRMLKTLGEDVTTVAYTGGLYGNMLKKLLERENIAVTDIETECETRLNIKIIADSGECTELNASGGDISTGEQVLFHNLIHNLLESQCENVDNYWLLCGSIPGGVDKNEYSLLIKQIKGYGSYVALDTSGSALRCGLEAGADLIKPNINELSSLAEKPLRDVDDVIEACGKVFHSYGCDVICTMGENGAVYLGKDGIIRVKSHRVEVKGFSGAGDTFLASYLYCKSKQCDTDYSMKFASAAAAAKVALPCTQVAAYDDIIKLMNGDN